MAAAAASRTAPRGEHGSEVSTVVQQSDPLLSSIQWLEEEHRQSKAAGLKLQQQFDQVQAGLWAQGDRVHQLEQAMAAMAAQSARIAKLEDDLRHTREALERLQEARHAEIDRGAAAERARQAEQERERQGLAQIVHKLESAESEDLYLRNRLTAVDEHLRRLQEGLAQVIQRLDDQDHQDEGTQARLQNLQEQLKRKDQDIDRLDSEQDALRKQDQLQLGRIQVLGEQVRRVEDFGAIRELETRLGTEFNEKLELQRMERQRLERLVAELSLGQEQQGNKGEELAQLLSQVEARVAGLAEAVSQLREQVWGLRDDMTAQLSEGIHLEEQQKRRFLAELEQELLELKNRAARLAPGPQP